MNRLIQSSMVFCAAIAVLRASTGVTGEPVGEPLVVHEWGTFTELQNDAGKPLPRINTDDEPVPDFVHGFGTSLLRTRLFGKRLPFEYNDLTVRLETPVIYFYPPRDQVDPMKVDVKVGLRDGWLSEFYPNAAYKAPGFEEKKRIQPNSTGTLTWKGLEIGGSGAYPETNEAVWLHPRNTRSATITNTEGESEKYLFYRGVGEFSGPVRVETDRQERLLTVSQKAGQEYHENPISGWLVHVRNNGGLAFRPVLLNGENVQTSYTFEPSEFSREGYAVLRQAMHQELVTNGLYHDEASSMLSTWNRAYFRSPGLRLFYIVPKSWVENQMPLSISCEAEIERVMVGRIELISDSQVEMVQQLRLCENPNREWMRNLTPYQFEKLNAVDLQLADLGFSIPAEFASFLQLGRFREAILHAELAEKPSANLHAFMHTYGLNPARLSASDAVVMESHNREVKD